MKRQDFLVVLAFMLLLEGYLSGNVTPAILGLLVSIYLLMVRSKVAVLVRGERHLESTRLEEGKPAEVRLVLRNRGGRSSIRVNQAAEGFEVRTPGGMELLPGDEVEVSYAIKPIHKGEFELPPAKVLAEDERGLYRGTFKIGEPLKLAVYPSLDSIKEAARMNQNIKLAEAYKKNPLAGTEGLEIKELREYQHGDDFKRIDWKASMRLGELIVREMIREDDADVYIFVDNTSEMRKGLRKAKVDYAANLALQLAAVLLKERHVGMVIYDELKAEFIRAGRGPGQLETMRRKLNLRWGRGEMSLRFDMNLKLSGKARSFLRRVFPLKKGRRGAKGVFEGLDLVKQPSVLILITDLSNPSDVYRAVAVARNTHRVIILSPNPVLFYSEKLDRETLKKLYRAYLEREALIKKFNTLVPTVDLGPSDYVRELSKVIG
ncbi:DUF58 domain-containing protein [Thermococcus sp.]|uniref:DUF58 domain-containing protein n=1 Tax=Thermococcus sp. TaxID=35749 RepID=UPI00263214CF|nr:DUF58 domain-containing protein [Thermococcus sp.]